MQSIFIKDQNFIPLPEPVCAAIGNFDGVHLGHQMVMEECKRHGYKSAVLTFYPHPSVLLKKIPNYRLLTPLEHKTEIISKLGIDFFIVIEFTEEFAKLNKEKFIEFLRYLNIKACVCGSDFTFGDKALGSVEDLKNNFDFFEVKKHVMNNLRISTTYIRELLAAGNVNEANLLLGRRFSIRGNVIFGTQHGRMIKFPTANIDYRNYFLPATGVYLVNVNIENVIFLGMCNIGHNPTFNFSEELRMETHIFNMDEDIYGNNIEVIFIERIRAEKKFSSVEELVYQLKVDKSACLELAGKKATESI